MNNKNNISDFHSCLSEERLVLYINDKLSEEESAKIEEHIKQCPICSDLIDGLLLMENPNEIFAFSASINSEIDILSSKPKKKSLFSPKTYRMLAAVVLLFAISGSVLLVNNLTKNSPELTKYDISKTIERDDVFAEEEFVASEQGKPEMQEKKSIKLPGNGLLVVENTDQKVNNKSETVAKDKNMEMFNNTSQPNTLSGNAYADLIALEQSATWLLLDDFTSIDTSPIIDEKKESTQNSEDRMIVTGEVLGGSAKGNLSTATTGRSKDESNKSDRDSAAKKVKSDIISSSESAPAVESELPLSIIISASEEEDENEEPIVFTIVEHPPVFPGGESALLKFISDNVTYPATAKEKSIQGKVFVRFVITKQGKVTSEEIVKGVDPILDEEALRVVRLMPDWKPGKQRGVPVNVSYIIPIQFKLF